MRVGRYRILLMVACGGGPVDDAIEAPVDDTVDAAPPDSPPIDTDLETDVDSVAPPIDTPAEPILLGQGFVHLGPALYAGWPRDVDGGNIAAHRYPVATSGFFADLDGDARPEIVLLGTRPPRSAGITVEVVRYDPTTQALSPDAALTARVRGMDVSLLGVVDVDGDGLPDAIPAHDSVPIGWGRASRRPTTRA